MVDDLTKHMETAYYHDYGLEMKSLAGALNLSLGEVVLLNLVYQVEQIGTACYKVSLGAMGRHGRIRACVALYRSIWVQNTPLLAHIGRRLWTHTGVYTRM